MHLLAFSCSGIFVAASVALAGHVDNVDNLLLLQLGQQVHDTEEHRAHGNQLKDSRAHSLHNMAEAPSGTKILDAYNACQLHAEPILSKGEVFTHSASETHFIHIYKNAGSSISQSPGMDKIVGWDEWEDGSIKNETGNFYPPELFLNKHTWFTTTLVRDPLERSVSAFHEVLQRNNCKDPVGKCDWFHPEEECMDCADQQGSQEVTINAVESFKKALLLPQSNYTHGDEVHLLPQLSFLTYHDGSKAHVDYIGWMDDFSNEFQFMFGMQAPLERSRAQTPSQTDLFPLKAADLPEDAIVEVCKFYHADYCCFGFDFPDACKTAGITWSV